jgi:hypothetical protein
MSLKEDLEVHLGSMMHHLQTVQIDKNARIHNEDATEITAFRRVGDEIKSLSATYLDRNKMTSGEIAYNFPNKLDKWLKGTLEEL